MLRVPVMHFKWIYYKNTFKHIAKKLRWILFYHKLSSKMILQKDALENILLQKYIGNDFTIKYITHDFIIKCTSNDFTIKMHWKVFYYRNAMQTLLQ